MLTYDEASRVPHRHIDANRGGSLEITSVTVKHPDVVQSKHTLPRISVIPDLGPMQLT